MDLRQCFAKSAEPIRPLRCLLLLLRCDIDTVTIQINVDGLTLFKSSNTQLWPTLGKLVNPKEQEPFITRIFFGSSKPTNLVEYLTGFVTEMNNLEEGGRLWQEARVQVKATTAIQPNTDTPKSGRRGDS